MKILIIDHEDSFVHILADYFIRLGTKVVIKGNADALKVLDKFYPDLVVLSPGPGLPKDFNCKQTIQALRERNLPIFGVCLGMQAIAEAYGAKLLQLPNPCHGKSSYIHIKKPNIVFENLETKITVGRYHSIYVDPLTLPKEFIVTSKSEDEIIMGIEHITEPIAAVQFHPESIMTSSNDSGIKIIKNVIKNLSINCRKNT
ncbi:anthranilate synthase component I [Candidatus Liberibacter americanus]|uniref:Anthranilate/para-aminobenzoate synthases component II n=1 Tax=Candidatus Liberibacter americanus str. Sao Paulo TaxID=1261131 RepID=U6B793_9HYPH|nr:anthranilate synthase component I [Candidatus Liberibacter americanus]AHA27706.1 Anthranilate/para-aminobenzoate synthases component II [Candidatus Liberibacter americanus str. Sao Paulo]EMS36413.1 anthranilate synthase [Candidatus Liberibacter americanus PW_SP]